MGGSSSAVEENYRDLPNFFFRKAFAICDALNPNPRALFVAERLLRVAQCIYGVLRKRFAGSSLHEGLVG